MTHRCSECGSDNCCCTKLQIAQEEDFLEEAPLSNKELEIIIRDALSNLRYPYDAYDALDTLIKRYNNLKVEKEEE